MTILANMLMLHRALAAAEGLAAEGVEAEVIDMRCLLPLDEDALARSVEKTHRVLIVEEDNLTGGWGAEVSARLGQRCFYNLDAPIARVAAADSPAPTEPALERAYLPDAQRITEAVRSLLEGG